MDYRNELTAAQARADAAMRDLEEEKEARQSDAERIARLERGLADALDELANLRERHGSASGEHEDGDVLTLTEAELRAELPPRPAVPWKKDFLLLMAAGALVALIIIAIGYLG